LNDISCLTDVPVFETPELPGKEKLGLYKYLSGARKQVHRGAMRRVFRSRIVGIPASYILANSLVERVFYQNTFFRGIVEGFRYRLATK
jgi:hypothetical protein